MAHTTSALSPKLRRQCRQMITLARRFERGAAVARAAGRPDYVLAERDARSLRCAADMLRCCDRGD